MAIIRGEIESLKRIKNELRRSGISRFNSVAEMKDFLKTYDQEKRYIRRQHEQRLRIEIAELHLKCNEYQSGYDEKECGLWNSVPLSVCYDLRLRRVSIRSSS
jgi:hypothetical protein